MVKFLLVLLLLICTQALADANRPAWVERSSYRQNDRIYFVGVTLNAKDLASGRVEALNAAFKEVKARFESFNTQYIETQMTYEEQTKTGFNVYRLVYIPSSYSDLNDDLDFCEMKLRWANQLLEVAGEQYWTQYMDQKTWDKLSKDNKIMLE